MVNKELLIILAMTISPLLYMLGGWKWKWLRRFVLPIVLGTILLISGKIWWKVLLFTIGQAIVFTLPYGERTSRWVKALVGCSYSIPSLIFGITIWQVILPVVFITMFILSNTKKLAHEFYWKACEGTVGFLIGIIIGRFIN